jgi:hypothetical protein
VNEGLRVCQTAVLITIWCGDRCICRQFYAGLPLLPEPHYPARRPASVRQAYTPDEMQALLKRTGASRTEIHRHYFFRMGVIAWK